MTTDIKKFKESMILEIKEAIITDIEKNYYLVPKKPLPDVQKKAEFCEYVINYVCERLCLQASRVKGAYRQEPYVNARGIIYRIAKKHCKGYVTQKMMGQFLGGRDHATVYNGLTKISNLYDTDKNFRSKFDEIEAGFLIDFNSKINKSINPHL